MTSLHLIFLVHGLLGEPSWFHSACSRRLRLQLAAGRLGREALAGSIFNAAAAQPLDSKTGVFQAHPKTLETS